MEPLLHLDISNKPGTSETPFKDKKYADLKLMETPKSPELSSSRLQFAVTSERNDVIKQNLFTAHKDASKLSQNIFKSSLFALDSESKLHPKKTSSGFDTSHSKPMFPSRFSSDKSTEGIHSKVPVVKFGSYSVSEQSNEVKENKTTILPNKVKDCYNPPGRSGAFLELNRSKVLKSQCSLRGVKAMEEAPSGGGCLSRDRATFPQVKKSEHMKSVCHPSTYPAPQKISSMNVGRLGVVHNHINAPKMASVKDKAHVVDSHHQQLPSKNMVIGGSHYPQNHTSDGACENLYFNPKAPTMTSSNVLGTPSALQSIPEAGGVGPLSQKRLPLSSLGFSTAQDKENIHGYLIPVVKATGDSHHSNRANKKTTPTGSCSASVCDETYVAHCNNGQEISSGQNQVPLAEKTHINTRKNFTINGNMYPVLNLLGQGGSSKVYTAYDATTKTVLAVKVVNLSNADPLSKQSYRNEISLLRQLENCQRVIKMFDFEYKEIEQMLYIVMEKGDTDLVQVLRDLCSRSEPLDFLSIKFYWGEMLKAVDEIHKRNIIHSDLKPANFIIVKGKLKLIDFGIASAVQSDMTSVIRDTQVGTANYMSPESLFDCSPTDIKKSIKLRPKSDVWSLGCILYNLAYGQTPFQPIKNLFAKMQAIRDPTYQINFPQLPDPLLLDVIKKCLQWDPVKRPSISELLEHPYLTFQQPKDHNINSVIDGLNSFSPNSIQRLSQALLSRQEKK